MRVTNPLVTQSSLVAELLSFFLAAAVNGHGPVEKEAGFGYRSWLSSQLPFSTPGQSELQSELDRCRANEPTVWQRGPLSPADRYNLTEGMIEGRDRIVSVCSLG